RHMGENPVAESTDGRNARRSVTPDVPLGAVCQRPGWSESSKEERFLARSYDLRMAEQKLLEPGGAASRTADNDQKSLHLAGSGSDICCRRSNAGRQSRRSDGDT